MPDTLGPSSLPPLSPLRPSVKAPSRTRLAASIALGAAVLGIGIAAAVIIFRSPERVKVHVNFNDGGGGIAVKDRQLSQGQNALSLSTATNPGTESSKFVTNPYRDFEIRQFDALPVTICDKAVADLIDSIRIRANAPDDAQLTLPFPADDAGFERTASIDAGVNRRLSATLLKNDNSFARVAFGHQRDAVVQPGFEVVTNVRQEDALHWESSRPQVAIVYPNGVVFPVSPGETQIRATACGKVSNVVTVVVPDPNGDEQDLRLRQLSWRPGNHLDTRFIDGTVISSATAINPPVGERVRRVTLSFRLADPERFFGAPIDGQATQRSRGYITMYLSYNDGATWTEPIVVDEAFTPEGTASVDIAVPEGAEGNAFRWAMRFVADDNFARVPDATLWNGDRENGVQPDLTNHPAQIPSLEGVIAPLSTPSPSLFPESLTRGLLTTAGSSTVAYALYVPRQNMSLFSNIWRVTQPADAPIGEADPVPIDRLNFVALLIANPNGGDRLLVQRNDLLSSVIRSSVAGVFEVQPIIGFQPPADPGGGPQGAIVSSPLPEVRILSLPELTLQLDDFSAELFFADAEAPVPPVPPVDIQPVQPVVPVVPVLPPPGDGNGANNGDAAGPDPVQDPADQQACIQDVENLAIGGEEPIRLPLCQGEDVVEDAPGDITVEPRVIHRGADRVIVKWGYADQAAEDALKAKAVSGKKLDFLKFSYLPLAGPGARKEADTYFDKTDVKTPFYAVLTGLQGGERCDAPGENLDCGRGVYTFRVTTDGVESDDLAFKTLNRLQTVMYDYELVFGDRLRSKGLDITKVEKDDALVQLRDQKRELGGRIDGIRFYNDPKSVDAHSDAKAASLSGVKFAIMNDRKFAEYGTRLLVTEQRRGTKKAVEHLYTAIQDRIYPENLAKICDAKGCAYWVAQVTRDDAKRIDLNGVALAMLLSEEYSGIQAQVAADPLRFFADYAYLTVLKRGGDEDGVKDLAKRFSQDPRPLDAMRLRLAESKEFKDRVTALEKSGGRRAAITELYETCFFRPADMAGVTYWTDQANLSVNTLREQFCKAGEKD